jgi:hypothetical protein
VTRHGHIAAAVAELEAEREHLCARLTKVDAAIAAIQAAFHLPAPAKPRQARTAAAAPNGNGRHGVLTDDAIVRALANGPLTPRALQDTLGAERTKLRRWLKDMKARGLVRVTGKTMSRRVELASTPAKEAP